jgi:hypothetical protein
MILQNKSLEKLRLLINEDTKYRSGPQLIKFFNELGFNDLYEQGFPTRSVYTDKNLEKINGTPELVECIKKLFSPINFIGEVDKLDGFIKDFNQYLTFDKWKIIRKNNEISLVQLNNIEVDNKVSIQNENEFLKREFQEIPIDSIGLDSSKVDPFVKTRKH